MSFRYGYGISLYKSAIYILVYKIRNITCELFSLSLVSRENDRFKLFDNLINNNIKKSKTVIINYCCWPLMVF
jgi:hypothetical protein